MQGPSSFLTNGLSSASEQLVWKQLIGSSSKSSQQKLEDVHGCLNDAGHPTRSSSHQSLALDKEQEASSSSSSGCCLIFHMLSLPKGCVTLINISQRWNTCVRASPARNHSGRARHPVFVCSLRRGSGWAAWRVLLLLLCQFSSPRDSSHVIFLLLILLFKPVPVPVLLHCAVAWDHSVRCAVKYLSNSTSLYFPP